MKFYYQTVSINRNSKKLKKDIMDYLKNEWAWDEDDFKDGFKETRYSLSFELMNDSKSVLLKDSDDLFDFIESVRTTGKVSRSQVTFK